MAQKNIDFGTFPDDPNADAIRTAFQKVQDNFTDLYSGLQSQAVLSVNKTPGAGLTVNSPTGNVVMTANIACVQVRTSTLSIGRDANGAQYASITQSSQALWVDLPSTISNVANANFSGYVLANYVNANISFNTLGNMNTGNANITSLLTVGANANVTGNLNVTANANVTANLNANNASTSNLLTVGANANITGNLNVTANANITANINSGNANLGNLAVANFFSGDGSLLTGVVAVAGPTIANGTSNVNIPASGGNVNISGGGVANVAVITGTGVNVAGTGNFSGNVSVANLLGPVANGNSNVNIPVANGNVNISAVGNANVLVVTGTGVNVAGTINATGNANVGNIGATNANITEMTATGNVSVGNLIGPVANGNSNVNIPAANGNVNISAVGNANILVVTGTGANITGTLNATGNANVGNIGATNANVTAITATGNANVGNLGTAQVLATANVTAPQLISNVATGTAPLVVTSTTQVANLSVATAGTATNATAVQTNASTTTTVYPTFVSASTNANYALNTVSGISANLANNAITATTFVGALSGTAANATNAAAVLSNTSTNTTVYLAGTSTAANGNVAFEKVTGIYANMGNNAITATTFVGALSGTAANATNAAAVLSNTSTSSTVYLLGTATSANGNVGLEKVTGITANYAANSISATFFNGNLFGNVFGQGNVGGDTNITGTGASGSSVGSQGGNVNVTGGEGYSTDALGGNINIKAGLAGTGNGIGGTTTVWGGNGNSTGSGGSSRLLGGTGNAATGGNIFAGGGTYAGVSGNAFVKGGIASGTDKAGGAVTVAGGIGTGAGQPGNIIFQTTDVLTTGTTTQTLANRIVISGNVVNVTTSVAATSTTTGALVVVGGMGVAGNVVAGAFYGPATGLTSIPGANVSGEVSFAATANAVAAANVSGQVANALIASTVYTAAQPNITSVGTLTSLGVTGNVTAGNLLGVHANGNSNVNIPAANGNVNISAVGNANIVVVTGTGANIAGTLNVTSNANVGNIGAARGVFTNIAGEGGNISNIQGANVSGAVSTATTAGTVTTNAQPNITSVGTLSALDVTGNLSSGNANLGNLAKANFFQGDGGLLSNITVTAGSSILNGTSNVTVDPSSNVRTSVAGVANVFVVTGSGANVTGTLNVTANANVGNLGAATVAATSLGGTLTTAAQPNITSIGTLTGLTVSGATNLGPIGNVTITGGSANYFLRTDGAGVLSWINATSLTTAPGANTQVLFNDAGAFQANANLTFNKTNGNLSVGGGLTVTGNATAGNANLGNLTTSNYFAGVLTTASQPNITTVGTLTALSVTTNMAANNVSATNYANAKYVSAVNGSLTTASIPAFSGTQTWNNSAVTFTGILENITDTASAANSLLIDLQVASASKFAVNKAGNVFFSGVLTGNGSGLSAIAGANVTGTVSAATTAGTVTTNAQPNITSVGTLTSLAASGTITGTRLISNIAAGTAPLTVTSTTRVANLNVATAGNADAATNAAAVLSNASTNTTVYLTGTSTSADGNVSLEKVTGIFANMAANSITATTFVGALSGTASAATNAAAVQTNASTTSTVYLAGVTSSSNGNRSLNVVSGITANFAANSITATTFTGALANGNSNVNIPSANGNINLTAVGNTTLVITGTGINVAGTLNTNSSNANVGNLGTAQVLASANVTAPQLISNVAGGTAPLVVTSTTRVANLNVATAGAADSATNASAVLNNVRSSGTYYPAFISATANGNYALNSNTAIYANLNSGTLYATAHDGNLYVSDTNYVTTVVKTGVVSGYFGPTPEISGEVSFQRFRGNVTVYTEALNGDRLGLIDFVAWDGFSPNTAASITSIVDATYTSGSGSAPGAILFNTANAAQGGVPTEKMRVASTGNVGIANTNPGHTLSITGTLNASGNANVGNLGTSGRVTASAFTSNVATGTAPFVVTSTTQVANLSVATAGSATTAGTVTTAAQPNITSVGTLSSLTVNGLGSFVGTLAAQNSPTVNLQGAWIGWNQSSGGGETNFINQQGSGGTGGFNWQNSTLLNARTTIATLTSAGAFSATSLQATALTTGANTTAGTVTGNWTLTAGSRWQATYADLAERYVADNAYEPGTVVVLGGENEVTIENVADSHKVAGVVTTNPAYIMNALLEGENVVEVALIGRVPCKVMGPVNKGDLLTTANIPGYAYANNAASAGRIVGKSLENFNGELGIVEIMVGKT